MTHLPFQLMGNFCNCENKPDSLFGIVGAPIDCATTFRSGARFGPKAIRDASAMLTDGVHASLPYNLPEYVSDLGNIAIPTNSIFDIQKSIEDYFDRNNMHTVTLGGDHSITLGVLRSRFKIYGKLSVIHFDAHCDTWPDHFGHKFGHGTWLRDAIEEGIVDPTKTVSIGIRSPADNESRNYLQQKGGMTITAYDAMTNYPPEMLCNFIMNFIDNYRVPTYLSFDVDCLDPAYAPGTGTPEIGGLTTMYVSQVFDNLKDHNFIGMDCVEVAPAYDHAEITSLAAATFCWKYLLRNIHRIVSE